MATLATEKEQLDTETQSLEKRKTELERGNRWIEKTIVESKAANAKIVKENSYLEKRKTELEESNSSLAATNTTLSNEKKQLEADKKKVAKEIADIEADKSKLIEERSTYAEEAEEAKKRKRPPCRKQPRRKPNVTQTERMPSAISPTDSPETRPNGLRLNSLNVGRKSRLSKTKAEETDKTHRNRVLDLQQQLDRQKKQEESIVRGHQETKDLIQRFFPGVIKALPAIRDCIEVKMPDNLITMLLDGKPRSFKSGATLYDPDEKKRC